MFIYAEDGLAYNLNHLRKVAIEQPSLEAEDEPVVGSGAAKYAASLFHVQGYFGDSEEAINLVACSQLDEAERRRDEIIEAAGGEFKIETHYI